MTFKAIKLFNKIDTVVGHCAYCEEEAVLVQLVQDFYRCTHCGEDTRQYTSMDSIKIFKTRQTRDQRMAKKSTFGVNTYRERSRKKIGRHKKRMNKHEKRNYKPYIGQGR